MNLCDKYFKTSIETQNKTGLVVKLYDGAIKFLNKAELSIKNGEFESKNNNISKAISIISELNISLDLDLGGEIAKNLRKLYNFYTRQLKSANINNDIGAIKQVIKGLGELNQGWKQISC